MPETRAEDVLGARIAISPLFKALFSSIMPEIKEEVASCLDWPFLTSVAEDRTRGSSLLFTEARLVCSMLARSPRAAETEGEKAGRDTASSSGRVRNVAAIATVGEKGRCRIRRDEADRKVVECEGELELELQG